MSRLWSTDGAARVETFLDRVSELSALHWLALGRDMEKDSGRAESSAAVVATVETIIAKCGLEVRAWYVRDLVETLAYVGTRRRNASVGDAYCLAGARSAAERAALAVLVSPYLSTTEFDVLYTPVAKYVARAAFA